VSFLGEGGSVPPRPPRDLTAGQAAGRLGLEVTTVKRHLRAGLFPGAYKSGPGRNAHWRVPPAAVEAFKTAMTPEHTRPARVDRDALTSPVAGSETEQR
jgi:hypothetical protein